MNVNFQLEKHKIWPLMIIIFKKTSINHVNLINKWRNNVAPEHKLKSCFLSVSKVKDLHFAGSTIVFDKMAVFRFQAKLMAALLVTFLLVELEAPMLLRSYEKLAIAFDSRSEGSRKINAGNASLDSDNKGEGEVSVGFSFRTRSLRSKRTPSPPPAPMRNRNKVTAKTFASAPSIHSPHWFSFSFY